MDMLRTKSYYMDFLCYVMSWYSGYGNFCSFVQLAEYPVCRVTSAAFNSNTGVSYLFWGQNPQLQENQTGAFK